MTLFKSISGFLTVISGIVWIITSRAVYVDTVEKNEELRCLGVDIISKNTELRYLGRFLFPCLSLILLPKWYSGNKAAVGSTLHASAVFSVGSLPYWGQMHRTQWRRSFVSLSRKRG